MRKHNAVGKVQSRLMVLSDQAVYNVDSDGKKVKRRIPFPSIGLVTASEPLGQFILHVPAEYDYLFAVSTRGYCPQDDAQPSGSALAGLLAELQRSYAAHAARVSPGAQAHLPVRTFSDAGPLAALVNKKKGGSSSSLLSNNSPRNSGLLTYSPAAEDEDDFD